MENEKSEEQKAREIAANEEAGRNIEELKTKQAAELAAANKSIDSIMDWIGSL